MSFWKKSMEYLGLGPDDAYDDYDDGSGTGTAGPSCPSVTRRWRSAAACSSAAVRGRPSPTPDGAGRAGAAQLPVA